ncbi:MAG: Gfo/Idh/MocA family oxidoreductase [Kiritimatiellae bacterium]|nr:Gfo/Idh/MocA family oxidoreductase [Kiritimatiellia bacterium]
MNMDTTMQDVSAARPPVRIGIVGAGRSVLQVHLPALQSLPDLFAVTAVCDLIKDHRDRVERAYPHVRHYRRYEDMLDDNEMDLVLVALPTVYHAKAALASLAKGRWTVVESPMALSHDQALVLRAAAIKARGRLLPSLPGYFSPEFRLARMALADSRLGDVYEAIVRRQDFVRRDDWQSIKRCGGGAAWYEGPDAVQQAVTLLGSAPSQLWSELKRIASLGDAEDTAHIALKGRGDMTVYIDIGGGRLDARGPAFEIRGSRGVFTVMPGAMSGTVRAIEPTFKFSRRRSSVRTPPVVDMHEDIPVREWPLALPDQDTAAAGYWKAVYETVRRAQPFPISLDDAVEAIHYLQVVKQSSPFSK